MKKSIAAVLGVSMLCMFGCSDNRNDDCESCDKATAGKEEKSTEKCTSKRCGLGSAIGSAMLGSKMSAMAINGRKLVMGIEMESVGKNSSLWPHLTEEDGLSTNPDEVQGNVYVTSTDYFRKLFDIDHHTSTYWEPWIDKDLLAMLWGFGVPAATPGTLKSENVAWTVAAGLPSSIEGAIPVLVSCNVDTSSFAVSGENDMSKRDEKIKLFDVPPFGVKGAVIVYKNGMARAFKADELTLKNVYSDMPVVSLPDGITLKYLRP
jgi:hypothetical protein